MQSQAPASLDQLKIFVPILSGVVGSLVTLVANHFYTRWKDHREKRERIFRTLMSTRGFRAYPAHVEALCGVEVEWTGEKDEKVRSAWKAYNHHLNTQGLPDDIKDPAFLAWSSTLEDLFADLIVALGDSIGKPQDKTDIKRGTYGPKSWWDHEHEWSLVRKGLLSVIWTGKGLAIPVSIQYDAVGQQQIAALIPKPKP